MTEGKHAAAAGPSRWALLRVDVRNWFAQIERKVLAGASASTVAGALFYLAGRYLYGGQVPDGARSLIDTVAPILAGTIAAYAAKHTIRPGALPAVVPAVRVISTPAGLADPAEPND